MAITKASIISQLKKDINALQGCKPVPGNMVHDTPLGVMNTAFPNGVFPTGAVHEFISAGREETTATTGFVSGLLAALMQNNGAAIWISNQQCLFPPALKLYGIQPERIIFISLNKEKEMLWVMEEALKCTGLAAVVAEISEVSFMASRRLQLAVEQSQVTGFILRNNPRSINTTACFTRWQITPLPSILPQGMPGVGFPRWKVELQKVRNGRPGNWEIEFAAGSFRHTSAMPPIVSIPLHKQQTG